MTGMFFPRQHEQKKPRFCPNRFMKKFIGRRYESRRNLLLKYQWNVCKTAKSFMDENYKLSTNKR